MNSLVEGRHTKRRGCKSLPIPWKRSIRPMVYSNIIFWRNEPSPWVTTQIVGEVGGWWRWSTFASNKALPHGRRLLNFEGARLLSSWGWLASISHNETYKDYVYRENFVNPLVLLFSILFWIFFYRYHHLPNIYNAQLLGWERMQMTKTWPLVITSHHIGNDIDVH